MKTRFLRTGAALLASVALACGFATSVYAEEPFNPIADKTITVTLTGGKEYDGKPLAPVFEFTRFPSALNNPRVTEHTSCDGFVKPGSYSVNIDVWEILDAEGRNLTPSAVFEKYAKVWTLNGKFFAFNDTLTITRRAAAITVGDAAMTAGGELPAFTAAADNFVPGDEPAGYDYTVIGDTGEPGVYDIVAAPRYPNESVIAECYEEIPVAAGRLTVTAPSETPPANPPMMPPAAPPAAPPATPPAEPVPAGPMAPAAPVVPAAPAILPAGGAGNMTANVTAEPETKPIDDDATPLAGTVTTAAETITAPEPAPTANAVSTAPWALLNLLIAVLCLLTAVFMPAGIFRGDKDSGIVRRVSAAVCGATAPLLFLLTENISGRMIVADAWTPIMAVILSAQVLCILPLRRMRQEKAKNTD